MSANNQTGGEVSWTTTIFQPIITARPPGGGLNTVDVVIATYNAERFIEETLDSIAAQTLRPDHILITDDGSTDATTEIVERWCKKSEIPVQLIRQDNRGPASARNAAILRSTADLIALADADDILSPDSLALLANAFARIKELALCFGDYSTFDSNGAIANRKVSNNKRFKEIAFKIHGTGVRIFAQEILASLLGGSYIPVSAAMFPRKLFLRIGLFDESLRQAEDLDLFIRLSRFKTVAYYPKMLSYKRVHGANLTRPSVEVVDYAFRAWNKLLCNAVLLGLTLEEINGVKRARIAAAHGLMYKSSQVGWRCYATYSRALWQQRIYRPTISWRHFARMIIVRRD